MAAEEEEAIDGIIVLVVDKFTYQLGVLKGEQVNLIPKHYKSAEEALAEKAKKEKKKP